MDPRQKTFESLLWRNWDELATLREQYDPDVQGLLAVIEGLRTSREQTAVSIAPGVPALRLDGQRILVVGDESHAPQYRQLVEALGGVFLFVLGSPDIMLGYSL